MKKYTRKYYSNLHFEFLSIVMDVGMLIYILLAVAESYYSPL